MMGQGQWALFHLVHPSVSFDASAMYIVATDADGEATTDTLVEQQLRVLLFLPISPSSSRGGWCR